MSENSEECYHLPTCIFRGMDLEAPKSVGDKIKLNDKSYKIDNVLDSNRVSFVYECAGSKFIIYQLKESKYDKNKLVNYSDGQKISVTKTNNDGTVESLCFDGILYTDNEKNRVIVAEKKGKTLKDYIEKNNTNNQGQTNLEERKEIFKNILEKVSEAHKYNIIHRNLCPANIIIDNNKIKLLGCEIAYLYNADESDSVLDELIDPRQDIEHYAYKSPEQICYSSVDKQSDIFSLGIICYKLFTGKHPFIDDKIKIEKNDEEKVRLNKIRKLLQNIATQEPPKDLNGSLPPGLSKIILKMLNKSVNKRYKNVEEIKNAFDKILFDFQIGNTVYYDKGNKEWKKFDKSLKSAGEILTWVVLDNNGKAALLLSEKGLCGKSFHDKSEDATWDTCSLREWLNKDFKEKFLVIKNNDKIETDLRDKIDETRGGVFCLSHQDVEKYFKDKLKDYKKCMMANENIGTVWTKGGNCNYWLRDEGGIDRTAKYIDFDGNEKSALKTNTDIAVRPAFWIKLD